MKSLVFSLTNLKRDWRSGEIRLIAIALIIAVSAVTTVSFFVDRLRQAMEAEAGTILGGDLSIESHHPLPEMALTKAHALGLQTTRTLSFRSMVSVGDRLQLVEVKAVEENYPLRGHLKIAEDPFGQSASTKQIPTPGTVWPDQRLLQMLDQSLGDAIALGQSRLTLAKVLLDEPDRGNQLFNIAPRLLMNLKDVESTGLLAPGSRAHYRLLLAGTRQDIEAYGRWVKENLAETIQVKGAREGRPELRTALQRADQFLTLAALTSVFLAGIAIAIAAKRYAERHQDNCAIMRCLGATQGTIIRIYAFTLFWLGLLTSFIGCAIAWFAQSGLAGLSSQILGGELPPASLLPLVSGILTGLVTLLGFALPPLIGLKDVPPMRTLHRNAVILPRHTYGIYIGAVIAIAALLPWQAGETALTLYVLGGSLIAALILIFLAWLFILISGLKLLQSRVGVAWRYGFANLARRQGSTLIQSLALGLGIMVMLLLTLVRSDLLTTWQANLPADAPNHFALNIQPNEVAAVRAFFAKQGQPVPRLYPNVHGRLIAINDTPIAAKHYDNHRAQHLAKHEFHLAWARELQADNQIVAGRWWPSAEPVQPQFSVETGVAETLGIKVGDTLTFRIATQTVTAPVASLRAVAWDSFNPNFFVMASPGLLEDYPATYLTGFYLPGEEKSLLTALGKEFPGITFLDVAALMQQIRAIINRVTLAIELIFAFTVTAGLVVLFATLQATHEERLHESAVFRTLGASRGTIVRGLAAEFLYLRAIAGTVAAIGALLIGYLVAERVLHISFHFNGWLLIAGLLAGGLGVSIAGLLGTRSVLQTPPLQTLRRI
jgi:putative ABC transport system permease protein